MEWGRRLNGEEASELAIWYTVSLLIAVVDVAEYSLFDSYLITSKFQTDEIHTNKYE